MKNVLDLILRINQKGCGDEILVPKLKAFTVRNMKNVIIELINKEVRIKNSNFSRLQLVH